MSRRQKNPLRALTDAERSWLQKIARSKRETSSHGTRARQLLAVAEGQSYTAAARASGRKSGDAVAQLVAGFNRQGLHSVEPRRGGGPKPKYGVRERERILAEVRRPPDPERDGAATWSLMLLRRALRQAPDGLAGVSTSTIRAVLQEAGFSWPRTRSWCETGSSKRKRRNGEVITVVDPDAEPKKS